MSVIAVWFGLLSACSAADYANLPLTDELIASGITIVDIRTEPEWQETGVVPGSVLLTFYRNDRSYDLEGFITELRQHIDPAQKIAILCRRGNRSARVSAMLAECGFRSVINLNGGVQAAGKNGLHLVPYPVGE